MGMFDTVRVYMECPYCGERRFLEAQTKDLERSLHRYESLSESDRKKELGLDRSELPVFPRFPEDKQPEVWESQQELIEARATIPEEYKDLDHIDVTVTCQSVQCQFDSNRDDILETGSVSGFGRTFEGKIKVEDGLLIGKVFDIEKDDLDEKDLSKYKEKYPEHFNELAERYDNEPMITRHWNKVKLDKESPKE